jgi:hypothetical protein
MAKKYCPKCAAYLDVHFFSKNPAKSDGLNSYCREHQKAYQRDWYARNKEKHVKQAMQRTQRVRAELRQWIRDYLTSHPCVDCGETDYLVLEFDHVRGRKKASVCDLIVRHGCGLKTLVAEIKKCEVRCANCHRRATAKKFGWYKAMGL